MRGRSAHLADAVRVGVGEDGWAALGGENENVVPPLGARPVRELGLHLVQGQLERLVQSSRGPAPSSRAPHTNRAAQTCCAEMRMRNSISSAGDRQLSTPSCARGLNVARAMVHGCVLCGGIEYHTGLKNSLWRFRLYGGTSAVLIFVERRLFTACTRTRAFLAPPTLFRSASTHIIQCLFPPRL